MKTIKPTILVMFILLISNICPAQSLTSKGQVSFEEDSYFIKEDNSTTVCVNIENPNNQNSSIQIKNTTSNSFLNFNPIIVNTTEEKFCFELNSNSFNDSIGIIEDNLIFEFGPSDSLFSEGPIASTSIYLQNDQNIFNESDQTSIPFLFTGFDNEFNDGFKISILVLESIKNGQLISISNSNYSSTTGWIPKNGVNHEQIKLQYVGNNLIQPGSIICIESLIPDTINSFGSSNDIKINILVNGEINQEFAVENTISNSFFSSSNWNNLYLFDIDFMESLVSQLDFNPIDGITVGINQQDFPFDIPFNHTNWQLFFFEEFGSYYGFIPCVNEVGCEFIEYFKNIENWTIGSGNRESELDMHEICLTNCDISNCLPTDITVQENCLGSKVDVLFLVDESGSINGSDIPSIKNSVKTASETIKCMIEDSRFAVSAFDSPNSYHNIIDFQFETVNIDDYTFQGGGTHVSSAYQKLLEDLNQGTLQIRQNAKFIIILLTDASSSYTPFTPSNSIRSAPYNATNLVIYFKDYNFDTAIPFAAAIASKGGNYVGNVAYNPYDPEGQGPPRKIYIYDDVVPDISEAIGDFNDCGELEIIASPPVQTVQTTTINNGGEVLSIESNIVHTNGIGQYIFEVFLENKCSYEVSYDFDTNNTCIVIPDGTGLTKRSNKDDHSKYEVNTPVKESTINLNLSPNPTSNKLNVTIDNINTAITSKLKIYSVDGILIDEYHVTSSKLILDVSKYIPGEYIINLYQNTNLLTNKAFVVIK